jgi:VIT1/CCC1 family predicted Fe2+/Mn2+ transporter
MRKEGFQGISFGVMDAVVTVLGVMIGLSVTSNKFILLIGVLTAGVADSFANAAGIHVSQETEIIHTKSEVFKCTIYCFFATLITVVILSIPVIILPLEYSVYVAISIGLLLLIGLGYFVSKMNDKFKPHILAIEYLIIGIVVTIICYFIGLYADVLLSYV